MITCKTRTRMSWVKIGKHKDPKVLLPAANSEMIVVRGFDLCKDLIGSVSICTQHFWLLVTGQRATPSQARVLDACLVAIAEHGLVPSVQAARMTYAAGPRSDAKNRARRHPRQLGDPGQRGASRTVPCENLRKRRQRGGCGERWRKNRAAEIPLPPLGHYPLHTDQDARAGRLVTVAKEVGVAGPHVAAAYAAEAVIREIMGRPLVLNVSGAIPAVLLDADSARRPERRSNPGSGGEPRRASRRGTSAADRLPAVRSRGAPQHRVRRTSACKFQT